MVAHLHARRFAKDRRVYNGLKVHHEMVVKRSGEKEKKPFQTPFRFLFSFLFTSPSAFAHVLPPPLLLFLSLLPLLFSLFLFLLFSLVTLFLSRNRNLRLLFIRIYRIVCDLYYLKIIKNSRDLHSPSLSFSLSSVTFF